MKTIWIYFSVLWGLGMSACAQPETYRHGQLANGLQYYLKATDHPDEALHLQFFVQTGSGFEEKGEFQFAHLLEHLAFKPTPTFKEGVKAFSGFQALGMTARDISANTGMSVTRYYLELPPGKSEGVALGLTWFKEIAAVLPLSDLAIAQEKGPVREEYIYSTHGDFAFAAADKQLAAAIYPHKAPVEVPLQAIAGICPEGLRRFYRKWYRPDLMHVVLVGPMEDLTAMENQIKAQLGGLAKASTPIPTQEISAPYYAQAPQFAVKSYVPESEVDPSETYVEFYTRYPELDQAVHSTTEYTDYVAFALMAHIVSKRYERLAGSTSGLPETVLYTDTYQYDAQPVGSCLSFRTQGRLSPDLLEQVFTPLLQIRDHGVLATEFEHAKAMYLGQQPVKVSDFWLRMLQDHIARDTPVWASQREEVAQWLESLSLADFNALVQSFSAQVPEDIGIIIPEGAAVDPLRAASLRAALAHAFEQQVSPYTQEVPAALYPAAEVAEWTPVNYREVTSDMPGTRTFVLANGAWVVLKPFTPSTGPGSASLGLRAFRKQGALCYAEEDLYSALSAPALLAALGAGAWNAEALQAYDEAHGIYYRQAYIDAYESGIELEGVGDELEALLQRLRTYFEVPTYREELEAIWEERFFQASAPVDQGVEELHRHLRDFYGDRAHPLSFGHRYLPEQERLKAAELAEGRRGLAIYADLFKQPEAFTFVLTGDFKPEKALPLLQKYLGHLPEGGTASTCAAPAIERPALPEGPIFKPYTSQGSMKNVRYRLDFAQAMDVETALETKVALEALADLAKVKLNRIRTEKGLSVYDFWVSDYHNYDEQRHVLSFEVNCQPEELAVVREECQKIIQELTQGAIAPPEWEEVKRHLAHRRYSRHAWNRHAAVQQRLFTHLRYELPPFSREDGLAYLAEMDLAKLQAIAQRFFIPERQYEFLLQESESTP